MCGAVRAPPSVTSDLSQSLADSMSSSSWDDNWPVFPLVLSCMLRSLQSSSAATLT